MRNAKSIPALLEMSYDRPMRTFLVFIGLIALAAVAVGGGAPQDRNAAPASTTTAADPAAKPGTGAGAPLRVVWQTRGRNSAG